MYYEKDLQENPHLQTFGCFNADIFKGMKKDEVEKTIVSNASSTARHLVTPEWMDEVAITATYDVVDYYYNTVAKVTAELTYTHLKGAELKSPVKTVRI